MIPEGLHYIGMRQSLLRGTGRLLADGPDGVALYQPESGCTMATAPDADAAARLAAALPRAELLLAHEEHTARALSAPAGLTVHPPDTLAVYTRQEPLPRTGVCDIYPLDESYIPRLAAVYESIPEESYFAGRVAAGECFGAFIDGAWAGFAGLHDEGTMGFLQVLPAFRRRGVATELEAYVINWCLARGWTPYAHIHGDNAPSLALQEKMGLTLCDGPVYWCY